ncbi:MAG: hypothetical protein DMF06_12755 [Verrucomicrobia bacterium]|nr:MAG: hypothetical protein DMF06_12755 [Verrucomicrobiota bacterium]
MNKIRPLSTAALALWLLTIGADAQKSAVAAPDYFPLRVGDSWTYRSTDGDTEHTIKVLSEEKQADGAIRYLVEKLAGAKVLTVFSKSGGWVLMHSERYPEHEGLEAKYEPAKQYLPDPLIAGTKWAWKGKDSAQTDLDENHQVVDVEDVTVLAGKFRAMKVVSRIVGAAPMTRTNWYADGVGLVKSETDGGQIKYGWELADYSFKKKTN